MFDGSKFAGGPATAAGVSRVPAACRLPDASPVHASHTYFLRQRNSILNTILIENTFHIVHFDFLSIFAA